MKKLWNLNRLHERKHKVYLMRTPTHGLQIMSKFHGVDKMWGCGHTFDVDEEKKLVETLKNANSLCPKCKSNAIYFKTISNNFFKDAKRLQKQNEIIGTKYYYPDPVEYYDSLGKGSFGTVTGYVFKFAEKDFMNNYKEEDFTSKDIKIIDDLFMKECIITKHAEGHPNIINLIAIHRIKRSFLMPVYSVSAFQYMKNVHYSRDHGRIKSDILTIYRCVKNAIQYIHSLYICHCDISSGNILIKVDPYSGTIKNVILVDFGMSLYFYDTGPYSRIAPLDFYNDSYQSPDILNIIVNKKKDLMGFEEFAAADKWAFGSTIYQLALKRQLIPYTEKTPDAIYSYLYDKILTKENDRGRYVDIAGYFHDYGRVKNDYGQNVDDEKELKFIEEMEHLMNFAPEARTWISTEPHYGMKDEERRRFRKIQRKPVDYTLGTWPNFYMLQDQSSSLEYRTFSNLTDSLNISKFTENILAYKDANIAFFEFVKKKYDDKWRNTKDDTHYKNIKYNIEGVIAQTIELCIRVFYDFQVVEIGKDESDEEFLANRKRDYTKCLIACYVAVLYYSINKEWHDDHIIKYIEDYIKSYTLTISAINNFAYEIIEFYDYDIIDIDNMKYNSSHIDIDVILYMFKRSRDSVYENEVNKLKTNDKKRKLEDK
jgi:serine/threonine protein kinase